MLLTAVITCKHSPRAIDGDVLLEFPPLNCHVTVFVSAVNEFEKTGCQVDLVHTHKKKYVPQLFQYIYKLGHLVQSVSLNERRKTPLYSQI